MKIAFLTQPRALLHDQCRTPLSSAAAADYQRIGIETGRRTILGRKVRVEGELRKFAKKYDSDRNVYTIDAVVDFQCARCNEAVATKVSIAQLDVKAIIGEQRCAACGEILQLVEHDHSQEEAGPDTDRLTIATVLKCRNIACRRRAFAFRALNVRMEQLLEEFATLDRPVDLGPPAAADEEFEIIRQMVVEADPSRFRQRFEAFADRIGRIDANLLADLERQSEPNAALGSKAELSRALQYVHDILKSGIGGAAGSVLFEILKRAGGILG